MLYFLYIFCCIFLYWANFVCDLMKGSLVLRRTRTLLNKISSNKRRSCEKLGQRTDEGHRGGNILDEETLPVGGEVFSPATALMTVLTADTRARRVDVLWTLAQKLSLIRICFLSNRESLRGPESSHLPSFPANSKKKQKRHQILQNTKKIKK